MAQQPDAPSTGVGSSGAAGLLVGTKPRQTVCDTPTSAMLRCADLQLELSGNHEGCADLHLEVGGHHGGCVGTAPAEFGGVSPLSLCRVLLSTPTTQQDREISCLFADSPVLGGGGAVGGAFSQRPALLPASSCAALGAFGSLFHPAACDYHHYAAAAVEPSSLPHLAFARDFVPCTDLSQHACGPGTSCLQHLPSSSEPLALLDGFSLMHQHQHSLGASAAVFQSHRDPVDALKMHHRQLHSLGVQFNAPESHTAAPAATNEHQHQHSLGAYAAAFQSHPDPVAALDMHQHQRHSLEVQLDALESHTAAAVATNEAHAAALLESYAVAVRAAAATASAHTFPSQPHHHSAAAAAYANACAAAAAAFSHAKPLPTCLCDSFSTAYDAPAAPCTWQYAPTILPHLPLSSHFPDPLCASCASHTHNRFADGADSARDHVSAAPPRSEQLPLHPHGLYAGAADSVRTHVSAAPPPLVHTHDRYAGAADSACAHVSTTPPPPEQLPLLLHPLPQSGCSTLDGQHILQSAAAAADATPLRLGSGGSLSVIRGGWAPDHQQQQQQQQLGQQCVPSGGPSFIGGGCAPDQQQQQQQLGQQYAPSGGLLVIGGGWVLEQQQLRGQLPSGGLSAIEKDWAPDQQQQQQQQHDLPTTLPDAAASSRPLLMRGSLLASLMRQQQQQMAQHQQQQQHLQQMKQHQRQQQHQQMAQHQQPQGWPQQMPLAPPPVHAPCYEPCCSSSGAGAKRSQTQAGPIQQDMVVGPKRART
ncbi:hypothetical protein FOA52_012621 [Chlamydomonas sp. UWO 241]|nr:hypothetical protein FOA52_012621 [Chlamydomonas sp. UWO 241]